MCRKRTELFLHSPKKSDGILIKQQIWAVTHEGFYECSSSCSSDAASVEGLTFLKNNSMLLSVRFNSATSVQKFCLPLWEADGVYWFVFVLLWTDSEKYSYIWRFITAWHVDLSVNSLDFIYLIVCILHYMSIQSISRLNFFWRNFYQISTKPLIFCRRFHINDHWSTQRQFSNRDASLTTYFLGQSPAPLGDQQQVLISIWTHFILLMGEAIMTTD